MRDALFKEAKSEILNLRMFEIKQNCDLTEFFRLKSVIVLKYYIRFNTTQFILVPVINFLNFP